MTLRPTSLIFKVIFVTSLILILAIFLSVWLNTRIHEANIKRLAYEKTKIISEYVENNIARAMEMGNHSEIHTILRDFVHPGIWKITLFGPDGRIVASTNKNELNKKVRDIDFFLNNQYFVKEETVQGKRGQRGTEKIYYLNSTIYNRPKCFRCHGSKGKIIGIMSIGNTLKEMDEEISLAKKDTLITSIITIGFLSSILGFLFLKFINVPITRLSEAMRKVEEGDLDVRVDVKSNDEMGKLTKNLNSMIEKLGLAKKETEQLHQKLIQRADRMAAIGELASGIAHEIRNPLAGIQGSIQILAEDFPKEDSKRKVADEIQKQIFKLERLVKDLLNYAKPVPPNCLPTDVNQLLDRVLSFFVTTRESSQAFKIRKKFFSNLPNIMIDPNLMEQAFLNIVLNAYTAMPEGGTFTVSTQPLNEDEIDKLSGIQIIFDDTGIGIPEKNLTKIFNPFFSSRSDGTGLGLSITQKIIEQHGGQIEVISQIGIGTKFTIILPTIKK